MSADAPTRDDAARRSLVPAAAGRSLWLAAAWTGIGAALLCSVVGIAVVAICWLPASGSSGSATSTIRAGVLTFLAGLHGGITVDGMPTAFLPLGMTLLIGLVAWRAGCALADAADDLDERRLSTLARAAALQAGAFAVVCALAAGFASLGTSSVSVLGALLAAFVLFAVTGSVAYVRWSPLADAVGERVPGWVGPAVRCATAGLVGYLATGAVLVAGSVLVHHDRVEALSGQVGGGWSGIPVLLLGILAAPNAAIAAVSYLAGPGFALGTGSHVSLFSTAHGLLPAFPVLGALPDGRGAPWPVWLLVAVSPLLAGGCAARVAYRSAPGWRERLPVLGAAAGFAALAATVLAWQGGGAIGSGRLNAIGASPWQFGLAMGVEVGVATLAVLGGAALVVRVRARRRAGRDHEVDEPMSVLRTAFAAAASVLADGKNPAEDDVPPGDTGRGSKLAG